MVKKNQSSVAAIIVAAGNSSRMGSGINKQLLLIDGIPVLARTLLNFNKSKLIDKIIIVTKQENILLTNDLVKEFGINKVTDIIPGGETRQESVMNGLMQTKNSDFVAVHDGARPFASSKLIDEVISAAYTYGAAAPGVIPKDTVKISNDNNYIVGTPDRKNLRLIQTPQVFRASDLKLAYIRAKESGFVGTDDCSVVEKMGIDIYITDGEYTNIKVTTPEDLPIAEAICAYLEK